MADKDQWFKFEEHLGIREGWDPPVSSDRDRKSGFEKYSQSWAQETLQNNGTTPLATTNLLKPIRYWFVINDVSNARVDKLSKIHNIKVVGKYWKEHNGSTQLHCLVMEIIPAVNGCWGHEFNHTKSPVITAERWSGCVRCCYWWSCFQKDRAQDRHQKHKRSKQQTGPRLNQMDNWILFIFEMIIEQLSLGTLIFLSITGSKDLKMDIINRLLYYAASSREPSLPWQFRKNLFGWLIQWWLNSVVMRHCFAANSGRASSTKGCKHSFSKSFQTLSTMSWIFISIVNLTPFLDIADPCAVQFISFSIIIFKADE